MTSLAGLVVVLMMLAQKIADLFDLVKTLICQYVDVDPATITEETNIRSDLGLNSLELINIAVAIEDEFDLEIPDREVANIETLGDAVKVIEKYIEG